jgi:8-oxo-dGTP diphosphatase
MSGHHNKGSSPELEIAAIRAAFSRATNEIRALSDPAEMFREATALGELALEMSSETGDFRNWLAADIVDTSGVSLGRLAGILGLSKSRIAQLVDAGRRKGNTVTDPGTDPELPAITAAIITSGGTVLVEKRNDRIPPWTFPAGEMLAGESPVETVLRRVPEETGITVTPSHVIGRRIHPKTGRVMIYVAASPDSTDISNGDPGDAAEVRWAALGELPELMPDLFGPVREYLDSQAG